MVRFIAAIDSKRGIADANGIPWQGQIPSDVKYYRSKIKDGTKLMGYGLYAELSKPMPDGINYVASTKQVKLKPGFQLVTDARQFQTDHQEDIWNLGGAMLFASTLDQADELYITQLDKEFNCTKFFPEFKDTFKLQSESEPITENGITFTFQVWGRK